MDREGSSNIKLGAFVLAGLVVLVLSLYMIGKSQNLFGSNFVLRARFHEVSGLKAGNNVRFSGIDAGTVKEVIIKNDTSIEVVLVLNKKLQSFISKNAIVDIGNEGLMGNKVVNITPVGIPSTPVEDGDMMQSKAEVNTGTMLETFSRTNENVEVISSDLKVALKRLNNSKPIWSLLEDTFLSRDIKIILTNFRKSSESFNNTTTDLHELVENIKKGEGVAGVLLSDKKEAENLKATLAHVKKVSENADRLTARLDSIAKQLQGELDHGQGAIPTLMRDKETTTRITKSLANIEEGSATFKEEMNALKQNKYLKKYLLKEEQQKKAK